MHKRYLAIPALLAGALVIGACTITPAVPAATPAATAAVAATPAATAAVAAPTEAAAAVATEAATTAAPAAAATEATTSTTAVATTAATEVVTTTTIVTTTVTTTTAQTPAGAATPLATESTLLPTPTPAAGAALTATAPITGTAVTTATATGTIVDIVATTPGLETLSAALNASGLTTSLQQAGPFTLFAPNNDAFAALPAGQLDTLLADPTQLVPLLQYHEVVDFAPSDRLATLGAALALPGTPISITVQTDGSLLINDAHIVQPDIPATNGVIHVIDKVLTPPGAAPTP